MPSDITLSELKTLDFSKHRSNKKREYVNNKELYNCFVEFYKHIEQCKIENKPEPPIPDKICQAILDISHNLSFSPKFINYTYKDEMIGDAIEVSIRYIKNFDIVKYNNPFAYITQIVYQAFVRRIKKEHRQYYYKIKTIQINNGFAAEEDQPNNTIDSTQTDMYTDTVSQVSEYERKHKEKYEETKNKTDNRKKVEKKRVLNNLEEFL